MPKKRIVVNQGWGGAIARLMKSNELLSTQTALAQKSGVGQTTLSRILLGTVNPHTETLELIAKAFGLTHSELVKLAESEVSGVLPPPRPYGDKLPRFVPIISWAQARRLPQYQVEDFVDWIECPNKQRGPQTVALKVLGRSMEPDYQRGDVIYVDPDAGAFHGKDVVVLLHTSGKVTFRRLIVDGTTRYLRPLNPVWSSNIKYVSTETRVLGVVVGMYRNK